MSVSEGLTGAWVTALGPSGRLVTDYSPYRQHATLTAGVTVASWSRGWAANYTGSTGATLAYSEHLHTGFPFAFAAWVKYVGAGSGGREILHTDTDTGTTNFWGWSFGAINSGTLNQDIFLLRYGNGSTTSRTLRASNPAVLVIDDWYHVAISIRAHITGDIWINGVSTGTVWAGTATGLAHNAGTTRIGYDTRTSRAWTNEIADVRTWGRAITEAEVRELYSGGPGYGLRPPRRRTLLLAPAIAITGTAAISTDAASATASGTQTHAGSGSSTTDPATTSATGEQIHAGTAAISTAETTATAAGTQTHQGTAAVTLGASTAAGSGSVLEGTVGAATVTTDAATATASGTQTHAGTAAVSTTGPSTTASGQVVEPTTGAVAHLLGPVTATGSGAVTVTGSAAIISGTVSSASSGLVGVTGTGQGTAGALCVSVGLVASQGVVNVTTSGVGVAIGGSVTAAGSVAVTTATATITASGLVPVVDVSLTGSIDRPALMGHIDVQALTGRIAVETLEGKKLWR